MEEIKKFKVRVAKDIVAQKYQQNYSASYHFSKGLLNNLLSVMLPHSPSVISNSKQSLSALEAMEYIRAWSQLIKEFKETTSQ